MRGFLLFLSVGALCAVSRLARAEVSAEPVRVALDFQSGAPRAVCLTPAALTSAVEAQLARPVFVAPASAAEADVTLTVRVVAVGSDTIVELELIRAGESLGGRTLVGSVERCAGLLDSLIVVVALLVDVPRDETPTPASPAPAAPSASPRQPPARPVRRPRPVLSELSLGVRSSLISGLLPRAVGSLGADVRWAFGFAPWLRLTAGADLFQDNRVLGRDRSEVTFGAADARFGFAPVRLQRGALRVEPWALLAVSTLSAEGRGFATNSSGARWLASTGLSVRAELPMASRLVLSAGAGIWLNLARPRFLAEDSPGVQRELYRPSRLMPSAELGLAWSFL